jgi:CRP/FNR family transcriptional regulator, anaerobic regulatory protein
MIELLQYVCRIDRRVCMIREDFLGAFPFFRNCPDSVIKDIIAVLRPQNFPEKQPVFRVGDVCGAIAFLLSGRIRVYTMGDSGREITLYDVEKGQVCILNVACILSHQSYPALATITRDASALLMQSSEFLRLVDTYPEMREFVFSGLGSRLLSMMSLVEEVAFRKLDERLREYLVRKSENGMVLATHQKIANDLGTSREIVTRVLQDFEQRGMVRLSRNQITVVHIP